MEIQQQPAAPNLYAALRVRYRLGVMKVLGLFRSRKQLPVNTLSDSGVAALMRYMYCRTKMLATTIVRSGSDRGGRHAFVSNFKGVGGKEIQHERVSPNVGAPHGLPTYQIAR